MVVAMNSKFSVVAIGTQWYAIYFAGGLGIDKVISGALEYANFPSTTGTMPKSHHVYLPESFNQYTGEVCALEWSSDGYVLAVGWKHGWGVFSVGGRCLALAFGPGDNVDGSKSVNLCASTSSCSQSMGRFQDIFMYGMQGLVGSYDCWKGRS